MDKIIKTYEETHFEWKISDFSRRVQFKNSPSFSFADDSWFLQLIPQSGTYSGFIALCLCNNSIREYSVKFNFGLKKVDGSVEQLLTGILEGHENMTRGSDRVIIIPISEVVRRKSELAPSDVLTITCTLWRGIPHSTQPNVLDKPKLKNLIKLETLSENFRDLLANKESCDTTLFVDNKEYKAHKAVLIARSSVFASMFQHEMSENQTGIITIPDCDPDSFSEFLEFLYCGQLEELSFSSALHLYETSDKYDVQELKTFCTDCIIHNLTVENVCDAVIMADNYDDTDLSSAAQIFFNENAKKIFEIGEWENLMKKHFRLGNKLLKRMSIKNKM